MCEILILQCAYGLFYKSYVYLQGNLFFGCFNYQLKLIAGKANRCLSVHC